MTEFLISKTKPHAQQFVDFLNEHKGVSAALTDSKNSGMGDGYFFWDNDNSYVKMVIDDNYSCFLERNNLERLDTKLP